MRYPFFVSDVVMALLESGACSYRGRGAAPTASTVLRCRGRVFSLRLGASERELLYRAGHARRLLGGVAGEPMLVEQLGEDRVRVTFTDDSACPPLELSVASTDGEQRLSAGELAQRVAGELAELAEARRRALADQDLEGALAAAESRMQAAARERAAAGARVLNLTSELSHEGRVRDEDHRRSLMLDLEDARESERRLSEQAGALSRAAADAAERLVGLRLLEEAFGVERAVSG